MSNYWENIFQAYQQSWRDRNPLKRQEILTEARTSFLSNDHHDDLAQIDWADKDLGCFLIHVIDTRSMPSANIAADSTAVAPEISDYLQHWQEPHSGSEGWPGHEVGCFIHNPSSFGWEIMVQVLEAAPTSEILSALAVRWLEFMFNYSYNATLLPQIEADAWKNNQVQQALSYIWVNEYAETYPLWENLMQSLGYLDLNDRVKLTLLHCGEKGICNVPAIQCIKNVTHSIKEAINILESAPAKIGVIPRLRAEIFKTRLISAGCDVEIQAC